MAGGPCSPVRMRTESSMGSTNITPSPISPVRAPLMMAFLADSTKSSLTPISSAPSQQVDFLFHAR